MGKAAAVFLVSLLGIGSLPLFGAPATDQALVTNVTLTEYTCEFSPFTKIPMLFVNYIITNTNPVTLHDLTLKYQLEYQDANGTMTSKESEGTITSLMMNWTVQDRVQVIQLPGEKVDYRIAKCKAWITGFYKEVPVTKRRTVTVKTGDKVNVAPDCREDYAELQAMKPGVEKREFAAKLVRLGCVSSEAVYGKRTRSYEDVQWRWVEYKQ